MEHGARAPLISNCLALAACTNSAIGLYAVAYQEKNILAYSFVAVYCMNFTIFLCVILKLFSVSFVSLLAPTPALVGESPPLMV